MFTLTMRDYQIVESALLDKFNAADGKEKAEIEDVWNIIKDEEESLYRNDLTEK